jgi:hypothetical protein
MTITNRAPESKGRRTERIGFDIEPLLFRIRRAGPPAVTRSKSHVAETRRTHFDQAKAASPRRAAKHAAARTTRGPSVTRDTHDPLRRAKPDRRPLAETLSRRPFLLRESALSRDPPSRRGNPCFAPFQPAKIAPRADSRRTTRRLGSPSSTPAPPSHNENSTNRSTPQRPV